MCVRRPEEPTASSRARRPSEEPLRRTLCASWWDGTLPQGGKGPSPGENTPPGCAHAPAGAAPCGEGAVAHPAGCHCTADYLGSSHRSAASSRPGLTTPDAALAAHPAGSRSSADYLGSSHRAIGEQVAALASVAQTAALASAWRKSRQHCQVQRNDRQLSLMHASSSHPTCLRPSPASVSAAHPAGSRSSTDYLGSSHRANSRRIPVL